MSMCKKMLTFSYDDGIYQDERLVEIFNKYGMKATFNLNTGIQSPESNFEIEGIKIARMEQEGLAKLYEGHEIALHGLTHASPSGIKPEDYRRNICRMPVTLRNYMENTRLAWLTLMVMYRIRSFRI